MAKKRFTDDLFGLFEDLQPAFPEDDKGVDKGADAGAVNEEEERVEVEVPVRTAKAKKKLSSKKFTADLDAFMSRDQERAASTPATGNPTKRGNQPAVLPRRRRKSGLDLLIRSTISKEEQAERSKKTVADTKRVTLIFKKNHIATLKEQAKDRGMYLKDVVQEMVSNYLRDHNE